MKKQLLFLFCFFLASFLSFAGKFILIPLNETNSLVKLFHSHDLIIHYYCDDFLLATTDNLTYSGSIILDENAFENNRPYAIIYCNDDYKEDYLTKNANTAQKLYSGKDFLIMKYFSEGFSPVKNDGIIMVKDSKASLTRGCSNYPVITEIDPIVQSLIEKINTDSLMANILHLQDYGTRAYFKSQAYEAQNWINEKFKKMGLEVELHFFSTAGNWMGQPDTSSANVIAIQRGTKYPNEFIVFGAHYDSYSNYYLYDAPGADDNASGTSGVLETARILSQYEFERSIVYCCFSAEEIGLYGSDDYATRCRQQDMNIVAYFNMDMIGYLVPGEEIKIHFSNPGTSKILANYCNNIGTIYFPEISITHNNYISNSDHRSFNIHGYFGITSIEFDFTKNLYYHQPEDIIGWGVNSSKQVLTFVKANLACIATLAMYDVPMPPLPLDAYPPTNCDAQYITGRKIQISWEAPADNTPKQYVIYKDEIKLTQTNKLQYNDILYPNDNDVHCYKVTADYWGIESEFSNESCASVPSNITEYNSKIKIYPNPTNNELRITNYELREGNIEIFDVYGRNVLSHTAYCIPQTVIDISHLSQGIYFVKFQDHHVLKFVKE